MKPIIAFTLALALGVSSAHAGSFNAHRIITASGAVLACQSLSAGVATNCLTEAGELIEQYVLAPGDTPE